MVNYKKAICIKNEDIYHNIIDLCIGKTYTIGVIKDTNSVYVYKDNGEMDIYLKSNFKLIEDFRQEKISKLINE